MLALRAATSGDEAKCARFEQVDTDNPFRWDIAYYRIFFRSPEHTVLMCHDLGAGEVVGCALFLPPEDVEDYGETFRTLQLVRIAVDPRFRGQGIARDIFGMLVSLFRDRIDQVTAYLVGEDDISGEFTRRLQFFVDDVVQIGPDRAAIHVCYSLDPGLRVIGSLLGGDPCVLKQQFPADGIFAS